MLITRRVVIAAACASALGALTASAQISLRGAVLPAASTPDVDRLLAELEAAYASMDVDRFTRLFTDDFEQIDVNRRVDVRGMEKWRDWTVLINGMHETMQRRHFGRIAQGDFVSVETEWSGRLKAKAAGWNEEPLDYRYRGLIVIELRNGKIARQSIYADYRSYREQFAPPVDESKPEND